MKFIKGQEKKADFQTHIEPENPLFVYSYYLVYL